MKAIVGTKVGMTQIFAGDQLIPVTVILAGPCPVVQKKTLERDGYAAVQLGFDAVRRVNRPLAGHFKEHGGAAPQRHLIEVRNMQAEGQVKVDIFSAGELVDVSGTSKGRGTAGVMKRHGFSGGSASHGNEGWHRRPGSIGQRKTPGRVYKGKRMAGHYGGTRVTSIGLEVVQVRPEDNLILVKGSVPGPSGGLVVVRQSSRRRAA